ncbi:hypothetical protein N8I71_16615 [Roseibacterium sp. SDUM158016]|jgi:hypothetical protein|uniref:hypothetical protein n=1 Tax=Roseicyclus sediminis TaxID=2980997 RepID=UPI0021D3ABE9|nr:hypothetical protein [Roseibacterium sp. SDUM158016]MCU4654465.1 hypothetical protein [Roseibacterium sp. SDUM158016]
MTTFNTNTDLNARGRQMQKAREAAETQVWRLVDMIPAFFARTAPDGRKELEKTARREAARRSVDNLLR